MAGEGERVNAIKFIWYDNKIPILLLGISIAVLSVSLSVLVKSYQQFKPIEFNTAEATGSGNPVSQFISVDIEGEVTSPGVYQLIEGSRVEDLLAKAGGFNERADMLYVSRSLNRAEKLTDGAKIYIPAGSETVMSHNENETSNDTPTSYNNQVNQAAVYPQAVNINLATKAELESLPGIGPVTAEKIITNRPYQILDDLVAKKVIGTSLFNKLKNSLSL